MKSVLIGQILKPTDVGAYLFRVKGELENILASVKAWRALGVEGNGVVPIAALPLEAKLEATLTEIDAMINIVSQIKAGRKKK